MEKNQRVASWAFSLVFSNGNYPAWETTWLNDVRFIGVKDISAVRLSLPAQLVEPVGNLE